VLLHPTSLPGRYPIGDLGPAADRFLDRLAAAGQSLWQVLPLGPTGLGDSPYGALSAFAGNPLLISPERLVEDGLLDAGELGPEATAIDRVDFSEARRVKAELLRLAFERFEAGRAPALTEESAAWAAAPEITRWLGDWALFAALRSVQGGRIWQEWPEALRRREPEALDAARREHGPHLRFHAFLQFLFDRQWLRLRREAAARGVALYGDLPIYLAPDAVDVWAGRDLFELDGEGRSTVVAGVPPDYFSADGQLWGNPLYRWAAMAADGYAWWVERVRANLRWFDLLRLDHFRGFAAYWEVSASATTAREGRWADGPGAQLFAALNAALGPLPLVAEDLGVITDDVVALRHAFGLPGMAILQFGFEDGQSDFQPHRLQPRSVVYTGTHDNDTTPGWFAATSATTRQRVLDYLGCGVADAPWAVVRAALTSVVDVAMVPMQDLLGLGSEARLNTPGIAEGNWAWRLRDGAFDDALVARLRRLTEVSERLAPPEAPAADEGPPPAQNS
jgi:4-alpha-glucanotransferase